MGHYYVLTEDYNHLIIFSPVIAINNISFLLKFVVILTGYNRRLLFNSIYFTFISWVSMFLLDSVWNITRFIYDPNQVLHYKTADYYAILFIIMTI